MVTQTRLSQADGIASLRSQINALSDADLALLVLVASASINDGPGIPQYVLEVARNSEDELEEFSCRVLGSGFLIGSLPINAALALGHFPNGLSSDGADLPPIVLVGTDGVPLDLSDIGVDRQR